MSGDVRIFTDLSRSCPCNFHPSGWLRSSALTCRLISLVGVKWSCLQINKPAFPPLRRWLEEEGAGRGVVDGTGGVVWGSARVLCEHLTAHPEVRPAFSGLGV